MITKNDTKMMFLIETFYILHGSHDSDSLLGMTRVVSGARMVQCIEPARPKRPPQGKRRARSTIRTLFGLYNYSYSRKKRFTCSARET